jgi:hypothetical protein
MTGKPHVMVALPPVEELPGIQSHTSGNPALITLTKALAIPTSLQILFYK